jgi:hypothetical protein
VFNNRVLHTVVAPVYGPETNAPYLSLQGNTPTGTPAGSQVYTGSLLAGAGYTAQLFGGPLATSEDQLLALDPPTSFLTAESVGFVAAPPNAITVPEVPADAQALLQLRVWDNRGGTVTNWAQVLANPSGLRGKSRVFTSMPLGGLFVAPPNLVGLESFDLTLGQPLPVTLRIAPASPNRIRLWFTGGSGWSPQILTSTNLLDWELLGAAAPTAQGWEYYDASWPAWPQRYYRMRSLTK